MDNKNFATLTTEFRKVMENSTEEEARKWLVDHYKELPKELQQKVLFLFFEEGLDKLAKSDDQVIADFQTKGLKLAEDLEERQKELKDRLKVLDIEDSLKKDK